MRVSSEVDAVEARYDGLRELLTQQLQSLPPGTGALAGEPLKIDGHDRDELSWVCPAGPGLLTRYATGDFQVSLRLRPHDAKSRQLDLGLLRKPKDDTAVSNEHETWVRLIDNVGTLQIRFFDSRLNTWVQRWTDTVTLPRLCRLHECHYEALEIARRRPSAFAVGSLFAGSLGHVVGIEHRFAS